MFVVTRDGEMVYAGEFAACNREAAIQLKYGQVVVRRANDNDARAMRHLRAALASAESRHAAVVEIFERTRQGA